MLYDLIASLRSSTSNDAATSRRRHPRRTNDRCVAVVHGHTFPVTDWSFGGVLLSGDDRLFGMEQDIDVTLKFKLRNAIQDITHRGRVVRKSSGRVAIEFEPVSQTIKRGFQQVIDDYVAREFANSQIPTT